jgi:hypothetical protein
MHRRDRGQRRWAWRGGRFLNLFDIVGREESLSTVALSFPPPIRNLSDERDLFSGSEAQLICASSEVEESAQYLLWSDVAGRP